MKKITSVAMLCLATIAFTQFGCAGQSPTTSTNVNSPTPAPTPDKVAIESALMKIENDWPRIIKEHDGAAVKKIEADDGVFLYPDGSLGDKATDVKDMESGAVTADSWEVSDLKVVVLGGDSAVVTGRTVVKNGKYNGQPFPYSDFRWVDTFARRNGLWQVVAGAATPVMKGSATSSPSPKMAASPNASPSKASPTPRSSPASRPSSATKPSPLVKPAATPMKMNTP